AKKRRGLSASSFVREVGSMDYLDLMEQLHIQSDSKVLLLVLDGLGGLPMTPELTVLTLAPASERDQQSCLETTIG
ncbi:MAG: hypothetical protein P8Y25_10215, partial [Chromatiaceae bacterium]